ncbi:MAG: cytochrome c [Bdellovibrionales bacterium]|nr:cytochrome c [Bdellovibrionales bacterium]
MDRLSTVALMLSLLILSACQGGPSKSGSAPNASNSCTPQGSLPVNPGVVTYDEDVVPQVFSRVCAECHSPPGAMLNLFDYDQAFASRALIRQYVTNRTMPPITAAINSLTPNEIELIQDWVDGGAVKSDAIATCK